MRKHGWDAHNTCKSMRNIQSVILFVIFSGWDKSFSGPWLFNCVHRNLNLHKYTQSTNSAESFLVESGTAVWFIVRKRGRPSHDRQWSCRWDLESNHAKERPVAVQKERRNGEEEEDYEEDGEQEGGIEVRFNNVWHRKRTEPETKGGVRASSERQKQHGSSSRSIDRFSIDPWYYADVHVSRTWVHGPVL